MISLWSKAFGSLAVLVHLELFNKKIVMCYYLLADVQHAMCFIVSQSACPRVFNLINLLHASGRWIAKQ